MLARRRRKLIQSGRHLDRLSAEKRHRIRMEAKKLRYASEFFSSLWTDRKHRKRYKVFIVALEDLQTCLGSLNDIQTGQEIAAKLARAAIAKGGGSNAPHAAASHLNQRDKRIARLVNSACKAHQRFSGAPSFWKS